MGNNNCWKQWNEKKLQKKIDETEAELVGALTIINDQIKVNGNQKLEVTATLKELQKKITETKDDTTLTRDEKKADLKLLVTERKLKLLEVDRLVVQIINLQSKRQRFERIRQENKKAMQEQQITNTISHLNIDSSELDKKVQNEQVALDKLGDALEIFDASVDDQTQEQNQTLGVDEEVEGMLGDEPGEPIQRKPVLKTPMKQKDMKIPLLPTGGAKKLRSEKEKVQQFE